MISVEQIEGLVEEKISGSDIFLVEVVIKPTNKIQVFLDSEHKVAISDCVAVSRHIEGSLDRDVEDFSLEVSSAGADRPLLLPKQYKIRLGRRLSVLKKDGQKYEGKLVKADEKEIGLEHEVVEKVEGKRKKVLQVKELNISDIKEAKVKISFK